MAKDRQLFVKEMKRILKSTGQAYLSLGAGSPWGFVGQAEWEQIMEGFNIVKGGSYKGKWAAVELKQN
jgi:hypothetical protein